MSHHLGWISRVVTCNLVLVSWHMIRESDLHNSKLMLQRFLTKSRLDYIHLTCDTHPLLQESGPPCRLLGYTVHRNVGCGSADIEEDLLTDHLVFSDQSFLMHPWERELYNKWQVPTSTPLGGTAPTADEFSRLAGSPLLVARLLGTY